MALASAPSVFAYYSSNYASTPLATHPGTAFTAGASDVDDAAVTCLSALAHEGQQLIVSVFGVSISGQQVNAVGDLLIDPAGGTSWSELVTDLCCGYTIVTNTIGAPMRYTLPLRVPAGASLGWRAKTNYSVGVATGRVLIEVMGGASRPEMCWWGGGVETLGVSDSKGTPITPGASGAWGAWTSVGSPTTRHCRAIQLGNNGHDTATAIARGYHYQIGAGSVPLPGTVIHSTISNASENTYRTAMPLMHCDVPVGTQLQVRATCSGTAPDIGLVGLYGVY